jgi:hypothetical protein
MVVAADIKKDLPNFPDEVIEMWLLPLSSQNGMGWPPPHPYGNSDWRWVLAEKELDWWKKVDWELEEADCSFPNLASGTRRTVQKMIDAHIGGEKNAYGAAPERFHTQLNHVLSHGKFMKPIVVVPVKSGLSVIDGNNRIAAHAYASSKLMTDEMLMERGGKRPTATQLTWRGAHREGEAIED